MPRQPQNSWENFNTRSSCCFLFRDISNAGFYEPFDVVVVFMPA
jgi:hypothetical protein